MTKEKKTRSELKREAIVTAAIDAFHQNGINETSMDKIAQLANVSKRTVYNHFDSKEKLVTHIFREMWKQSQTLIVQEYQPDQPLQQQLSSILLAELQCMSCGVYVEMVRFAVGYFIHKPDEMKEYSDEFMQTDTALKRWIKSALEDGKLKDLDVETANNQLLNLLKGEAFWPQIFCIEPCLAQEQQQKLVADSVGMFLAFYQK